jgi:hypothetical protein
MDSRPWWRRWLPEPFWWTLLALLVLSLLGMLPFMAVGALFWPDASPAAVEIPSYLLAIPCVWWLHRERPR